MKTPKENYHERKPDLNSNFWFKIELYLINKGASGFTSNTL